MPEAGKAGTVQLKYKLVNGYTVDVSIINTTEAVEPLSEYSVATFEKTVPYIVLVPIVLTNEQLENEHELLGISKY